MIAALLPVLGPILGQAVRSIFPDPADKHKAYELQAKLELEVMNNAAAIENAAANIIKAEAESESWLAANWRPMTMLTFLGLIVAKWFGYAAPGITEALEMKLFDIVEIGLGGYVIGRSVEKAAPAVAAVFKR
jgi:hypothetical protein